MAQKKRGNKLNSSQKTQIVQWLAEFVEPEDIVVRVKTFFGVDVTIQAILHYTTPNAAKRLREMFVNHRAAYLADIDSISLRHKRVRLNELCDRYRDLVKRKQHEAAARILKQISEEVGDAQELKRLELTGRNGGPIQTEEEFRKVVFYIPDNGRDKQHS